MRDSGCPSDGPRGAPHEARPRAAGPRVHARDRLDSRTVSEPETESEHDAAIARVRAAAETGTAPEPADLRRLLEVLDAARAESAARWEAIGRLAPAAKAQRGRARDAMQLLRELRAAAAAGADLEPLLARSTKLPDP